MKKWYVKYFDLYPRGVCLQCKEKCDDIFCDAKCCVLWEKDNQIEEITRLRTKMVAEHRMVKKIEDPIKRNLSLTNVDLKAKRLSKLTQMIRW